MVLTGKEVYEGFSKENRERYNKEVDEKFGPGTVRDSKEGIKKMSKNNCTV